MGFGLASRRGLSHARHGRGSGADRRGLWRSLWSLNPEAERRPVGHQAMGLIQKRCHGCVGRGEYDQPRAAIAMMMAAGETVGRILRSEEHTSELQSLMRNSYAVFCLKKNKKRCAS